MPLLAVLIKWEIEIFLFVLAGSVAIKLLTGEINTEGLLYGRISGKPKGQDRYFSPERVQLLIFTVAAGLHYLSLVLNNPNPGTFPEVPQSWPFVIGGSNAIYLGGKVYARWFGNRSSNNQKGANDDGNG